MISADLSGTALPSYRPPSEVVHWIRAHQGETGERWLADLDQLVHHFVSAWQLQITSEALHGGMTSFVVHCLDQHGLQCVFKACPDKTLIADECEALRYWQGSDAVPRLLAEDREAGVLLLVRVLPGTEIRHLPDDDETLERVGALLGRLHAYQPSMDAVHLPSLADRAQARVQLIRDALSPSRAGSMERLANWLLASQPEEVILHGDLGQGNILDAGNGRLVAIDPRGRRGERAYDIAVFAQKGGIDRALTRASRLARWCGVDEQRALGWTRIRLASHAGYLTREGHDPDEAARALDLALGMETRATRVSSPPSGVEMPGTAGRLRIAIIAPPWLPVPPSAYGGTENVLDALAVGLRDAGHEVTLCTVGDSTCPVPTVGVLPHAISLDADRSIDEIRYALHAYESIRCADIVHDHTLVGSLHSAAFPQLPVVTTNHGPFTADLRELYRALSKRVPVIAISRHQAATAAGIPIAAVIYHGVRLADFPAGEGGGGYAVFLGRMHHTKAPHLAAEIARAAGIPLKIAAKMSDPQEHAYFDARVRPLLGADITYLGEVDTSTKIELLAHAECLLNPIQWPEPFGMVMIEALACGTPVVTTGCGAAAEIIKDGIIGVVRGDRAGIIKAFGRVHTLDRSACRAWVAERFSVQRMVAEHVALYREVLQKPTTLCGGSVADASPRSGAVTAGAMFNSS